MRALDIQKEYEQWQRADEMRQARLITLKQFCETTSTAESTAREWIAKGRLHAVSANGHHLRIPVTEITRLFQPVKPSTQGD